MKGKYLFGGMFLVVLLLALGACGSPAPANSPQESIETVAEESTAAEEVESKDAPQELEAEEEQAKDVEVVDEAPTYHGDGFYLTLPDYWRDKVVQIESNIGIRNGWVGVGLADNPDIRLFEVGPITQPVADWPMGPIEVTDVDGATLELYMADDGNTWGILTNQVGTKLELSSMNFFWWNVPGEGFYENITQEQVNLYSDLATMGAVKEFTDTYEINEACIRELANYITFDSDANNANSLAPNTDEIPNSINVVLEQENIATTPLTYTGVLRVFAVPEGVYFQDKVGEPNYYLELSQPVRLTVTLDGYTFTSDTNEVGVYLGENPEMEANLGKTVTVQGTYTYSSKALYMKQINIEGEIVQIY